MEKTAAEEAARRLEGAGPEELIRFAATELGGVVKVASSFGAEDVALIDLCARVAPSLKIFTLDTGRLPEESYEVMERIRARYDVSIECYFPERAAVEALVGAHGLYSFRESVESRRACCAIRKVEPLCRALAGTAGWLTGLRRDQSPTRATARGVEWDGLHGIVKVNPLVDWTEPALWAYLRANNVPVSALHAKGFPSIGCAPCTRAIEPGEDVRAGRWWWENPDKKECGLHR